MGIHVRPNGRADDGSYVAISIAYMHYVRIEKEKIKEVAVAYENAQLQLYNALDIEFAKDLQDWDARDG